MLDSLFLYTLFNQSNQNGYTMLFSVLVLEKNSKGKKTTWLDLYPTYVGYYCDCSTCTAFNLVKLSLVVI